jgi:chorismate mutase
MKAGRGATIIKENSESAILKGAEELFTAFVEKNRLKEDEIVSVIFTSTRDITKAFPSKAVRELGYTDTALLDMEQKFVETDLPLCIRMLVFAETDRPLAPVYLHGAKALRKDLFEEDKP